MLLILRATLASISLALVSEMKIIRFKRRQKHFVTESEEIEGLVLLRVPGL